MTRSLRTEIITATQGIHTLLHHDPVLSRLTASDVTMAQYQRALAVLGEFYHAVEHQRRAFGAWETFSLRRECTALLVDLPGHLPGTGLVQFDNRQELLGGLYVAHGASFGRNAFRDNVLRALPNGPKVFVNLRSSVLIWRALLEKLEALGAAPGNRDALLRGAQISFKAVARCASQSAHWP